jgi:hypothetical protein
LDVGDVVLAGAHRGDAGEHHRELNRASGDIRGLHSVNEIVQLQISRRAAWVRTDTCGGEVGRSNAGAGCAIHADCRVLADESSENAAADRRFESNVGDNDQRVAGQHRFTRINGETGALFNDSDAARATNRVGARGTGFAR